MLFGSFLLEEAAIVIRILFFQPVSSPNGGRQEDISLALDESFAVIDFGPESEDSGSEVGRKPEAVDSDNKSEAEQPQQNDREEDLVSSESDTSSSEDEETRPVAVSEEPVEEDFESSEQPTTVTPPATLTTTYHLSAKDDDEELTTTTTATGTATTTHFDYDSLELQLPGPPSGFVDPPQTSSSSSSSGIKHVKKAKPLVKSHSLWNENWST